MNYHIAAVITAFLIAGLVSVLVSIITANRIRDEDLIAARKITQKREQQVKEEKYRKIFFRKKSSYEEKVLELSRFGIDYHIGKSITPTEYLMIKICIAILTGMVGIFAIGPAGCITGVTGYMLPTLFFKSQNERDNEKMLPDIKTVYDTLIVSLEAGVFLTEAIADCYQRIEFKRLKKALLELNSELIAKNQMEDALNAFECKFNNDYISNLCVILRQSSQSGLSVDMLADMAKHLNDVTKALNLKRQRKLDGEELKIEIMLYLGIIAVCLYITLSNFGSTLNQLF